MGGSVDFVDLFDVKVVDGYILRCDVVNDLNGRLKYIFDVYETYGVALIFHVNTDALLELRLKCLDVINIISYLRKMSLLSEKSLSYESERLHSIVFEITDILERREEDGT